MPSPADLSAALAEHAARSPEDPWLFYPEGLDWRWVSFGALTSPALFSQAGRGGRTTWEGVLQVVYDEPAQRELVGSGERLAARIGPPPAGRRDVVVLSGPWSEPVARSMLSWSVVTGAAVVLEPEPERRVATAAWARPTVFHGSAAEVAALRRAAESKRKGPPFGRLRTVLLSEDDEPLAADGAWLAERGVEIVRGALRFLR